MYECQSAPPMAETIHTLSIRGMSCDGCSGRVTKVLEGTPGVLKADVSHDADSGKITTTEALSTEEVIEIIESIGFSATA